MKSKIVFPALAAIAILCIACEGSIVKDQVNKEDAATSIEKAKPKEDQLPVEAVNQTAPVPKGASKGETVLSSVKEVGESEQESSDQKVEAAEPVVDPAP